MMQLQLVASVVTSLHIFFFGSVHGANLRLHGSRTQEAENSQSVHYVFVTDCSAYQFNQGNQNLASAAAVGQPGKFTWVMYGCTDEAQRGEMKKLAHPSANVFFADASKLIHPKTGKPYQDFQASNRPVALREWWRATKPKEEALAILDPDMTWMRPVDLVHNPRQDEAYEGPWETQAVSPKQGSGAQYGIGCVLARFDENQLQNVCDGNAGCLNMAKSPNCAQFYSSGPPWIMHKSDAGDIFENWVGNAITVHENWPDMLAEQGSFGITQAKLGITNKIDAFWFLSAPDAWEQPWKSTLQVNYDPCNAREPPTKFMNLPPLFHACSTFRIPYISDKEFDHFRLHKDHIHKDILDCSAPLLEYPPKDALQHYVSSDLLQMAPSSNASVFRTNDMSSFADTWSVCTYTNLVNFYGAKYKTQYCDKPNLVANFSYPGHASGFLNPSSRLQQIFRGGGWQDVDYTIGKEKAKVL